MPKQLNAAWPIIIHTLSDTGCARERVCVRIYEPKYGGGNRANETLLSPHSPNTGFSAGIRVALGAALIEGTQSVNNTQY